MYFSGDVSSVEYVDSGVETNDDLFVTMVSKGTELDSDCHQLIGTLGKTISFLKDTYEHWQPDSRY